MWQRARRDARPSAMSAARACSVGRPPPSPPAVWGNIREYRFVMANQCQAGGSSNHPSYQVTYTPGIDLTHPCYENVQDHHQTFVLNQQGMNTNVHVDDHPHGINEQGMEPNAQSSKPAAVSRDKNYLMAEDEVLCSAYLNISKDPTVGTSQSAKAYWTRITEYFNEFRSTPVYRTSNSLQKHWGDIKTQTSLFSACFSEIQRRNESGKSEEDKIKDALVLFQGRFKNKPYKFLHCWFILRNEQKWNELVGTLFNNNRACEPVVQGSPSVEAEPSQETADRRRFERPMGRDRAKKQRNSSSSSNSSACFEMLQKMQLDRAKLTEDMRTATKDEQEEMSSRSDRKLALQEKQVELAERSTLIQERMLQLQEKERADRVMAMNAEAAAPWIRDYIIEEQKSIAAKARDERAKLQSDGHTLP